MHDLYDDSFSKQEKFIYKLEQKNKASGKKTDFDSIKKSINRSNNKIIGKLLRIIREEDNPIKQLLSCHNILQNIPNNEKEIDFIGVLYGGSEITISSGG